MRGDKKRGYDDAVAKKKMEPNCNPEYYQGYFIGLCDMMDKESDPMTHPVDSSDED